MEKLISKILLLCALIGVVFGAYSYTQERPSALIKDLHDKVDRSLSDVKAEKDLDIRQMRKEIKETVNAASGQVMNRLEKIDQRIEKMDDRLFEMQRQQVRQQIDAQIRRGEVVVEDI